MSTARIHIGDVRTVLATMPANSVDLVLASPPFLALRSYLPADHPDKAFELGSEATPGEYLDNLLDVIEACDRVLAPHGSLAVELGDTYAGSGGAGGDYNEGGLRDGQPAFKASRTGWHRSGKEDPDRYRSLEAVDSGSPNGGDGWPSSKSLCLIPELFRFALAYGFNPLTGRSTPTWRIRNVIRWARPNPPVGALADKMRPATSDMVIACHNRDRYFDLDSIRSGSSATRPTLGATLGTAAVGREVSGTLNTGNGPNVTRWWCDLSQAKVTIDGPMARQAETLEIAQLIGVKVRVETPEGLKVMDVQAAPTAAALATVTVTVKSLLADFLPVGPSVIDTAASVCGAVLTPPVGTAPSSIALEAAEVVNVDGALIPNDRLAARLTLKIDGALAYAWLVAPITSPHDDQSIASGLSTGAPPLDWWQPLPEEQTMWDQWAEQMWIIPTAAFPGAHYATFPPMLCVRPIEAMVPQKVCVVCGEPSRRITSEPTYERTDTDLVPARLAMTNGDRVAAGVNQFTQTNGANTSVTRRTATLGWTDCGHDNWRTGVVLDPFAGSGTTLAVATGHGRDAIGIDLDARNLDLIRGRCGMFLEEIA